MVTADRTWLLLAYRVPRNPSANRVYVWRKLKTLGAIALQDAVWVLPNLASTLEQFRWLASEIVEMSGQASLLQATNLMAGHDDALVAKFVEQVAIPYKGILAALRERKPSLSTLSRKYRQTLAQDYFRCELGNIVRDQLIAAQNEVNR